MNKSVGPYTGKPVFILREKNPANYIQNQPFRFTAKSENERVTDTIKKLHPM